MSTHLAAKRHFRATGRRPGAKQLPYLMDKPGDKLQETGMDLSRELLAYAIIGLVILIGAPSLGVMLHRRKRRRLRQRGIKRYGH